VKPDEPPSPELRVAFIGGGSGGHLFPAIAAGHSLLSLHPGAKLRFLCSSRPVDMQVLATAEWPAEVAQAVPYVRMAARRGVLYQLALLPEWIQGYRTARRTLLSFRPHVAVGVGASASIPGMLAANRLKIPLVLMEQNTIPGQATRVLAQWAKLTLAGMPFQMQSAKTWPSELKVTGTPVRSEISRLRAAPRDLSGRSRLLILGGSQGSASVNRLVLEALADEHCVPSDWQIIHQTGESQVKQVAAEYARRGRTATVLSFLPNLPELLATATVVVSRGGAGTLQELACAGTPAILIPFSHAAANHQLANAQRLAANGAAALVEETSNDAGLQLRQLLNSFVNSAQIREKYRLGIGQFAAPEAADVSASLISEVAGFHLQ